MKMLVVMFVLTSYVLSAPSTVEAYHLQTPYTEKNFSNNDSKGVGINYISIYKINKVYPVERNNATDDAQKVVGQVVGGGSGGSSGSSDESSSGSSNSTGSSDTSGGYSNDKEPPKAISNGPYFANEGDEILFDAKASTDSSGISRYEWDFGDGVKAEGGVVKHRFYVEGTYTITLRVVDGADNESVTTTSAKIKNVPPLIKELDSNNQETCITLNGSFSDPGILDTHSATIDWGDGTTALGKIIEKDGSGTIQGTHVYLKNGKYNAEVKLYDNDSFDSKKTSVLITKQFDYSINLERNELVIERGGVGINTVSVNMPSCSSEGVALHVNGLPQGTSGEFLSKNNASSSRVLVVSTASSSSLGESTITVTADVGGIAKTESFLLKIVEPRTAAQNNTSLPAPSLPSLPTPSLQLLISSDKNSGNVPLDVAFQAIAAGGEPPYTWTVDFGDGTNQTLDLEGTKVELTHKYTKQGNYEVLFEVKDSSGIMSKNEMLKIAVESLLGKIRIFTTSIIEEARFDAKTGSITILASGPEGSNGSASLTVPKTILNPPFAVNINGVKTDFDLAEESDDYVLSFSYLHSTKLIRVTGLPVGSLQASDSVEDMIDVTHVTMPLTIDSGNNNNNNTSSQEISPSLVMMMVIGTGGAAAAAAGAIYYTTVVKRKHRTRMDIEPSTMHGTEQKVTIEIIPKAITLSPGETVTFYARAYDKENKEVNNINFSWSTTVKDAMLIPDGRSAKFTAPGQADIGDTKLFGIRKGEVIASYGNSAASANVEVHEY